MCRILLQITEGNGYPSAQVRSPLLLKQAETEEKQTACQTFYHLQYVPLPLLRFSFIGFRNSLDVLSLKIQIRHVK